MDMPNEAPCSSGRWNLGVRRREIKSVDDRLSMDDSVPSAVSVLTIIDHLSCLGLCGHTRVLRDLGIILQLSTLASAITSICDLRGILASCPSRVEEPAEILPVDVDYIAGRIKKEALYTA